MEVRRTVPVKLDVADSDAALLHETISEFLWAANYVVDHAWQGEYKTTSKAQLQRETYDDVRAKTRLQANLVQNARNKAADAVQSVVARWKQVTTRESRASPPRRSSTTSDVRRSTTTTRRSRPLRDVSPPDMFSPTGIARRLIQSFCSTTTTT